jgi:hypothetical protein
MSAGCFLHEFLRRAHAVPGVQAWLGADVPTLRELMTRQLDTLHTVLRGKSLLVRPSPQPLPLALRERFRSQLKRLRQRLDELDAWALVLDVLPVELHELPDVESLHTRRAVARSRCRSTVAVEWQPAPPGEGLRCVYERLLSQFFYRASRVVVRPLDAERTTYDVFELTVEREGEAPLSAFAKFGPPERLEREFINFNRLAAALAATPAGGRLPLQRFFGYGFLSDASRMIVESPPDFLGLFVASFHARGGAPAGGARAPHGRLDHLRFEGEAPEQAQPLFAEICKALALLQGRLLPCDAGDKDPYADFFPPRRVATLSFIQEHIFADVGNPPPPGCGTFRVERAELVAPDDNGAVDQLCCDVRPVEDSTLPAEEDKELPPIQFSRDEVLRLTLASPAESAIEQAFISNVHVSGDLFVYWSQLRRNLVDGWVEQLQKLLEEGHFRFLPPGERAEVEGPILEAFAAMDAGPCPRPVILAERIHGDCYLANFLWSREANGPIDFSVIDFEKMRFQAPAAWDYVTLELSLRVHWFLRNFQADLQGPRPWSYQMNFRPIIDRLSDIEASLATLSAPRQGRTAVERARVLLCDLIKTIRESYHAACKPLGVTDGDLRAGYNHALSVAAACLALWRRPNRPVDNPLVLRTIWMSRVVANARDGSCALRRKPAPRRHPPRAS